MLNNTSKTSRLSILAVGLIVTLFSSPQLASAEWTKSELDSIVNSWWNCYQSDADFARGEMFSSYVQSQFCDFDGDTLTGFKSLVLGDPDYYENTMLTILEADSLGAYTRLACMDFVRNIGMSIADSVFSAALDSQYENEVRLFAAFQCIDSDWIDAKDILLANNAFGAFVNITATQWGDVESDIEDIIDYGTADLQIDAAVAWDAHNSQNTEVLRIAKAVMDSSSNSPTARRAQFQAVSILAESDETDKLEYISKGFSSGSQFIERAAFEAVFRMAKLGDAASIDTIEDIAENEIVGLRDMGNYVIVNQTDNMNARNVRPFYPRWDYVWWPGMPGRH